jgi:SAM-dependent methyltransferase
MDSLGSLSSLEDASFEKLRELRALFINMNFNELALAAGESCAAGLVEIARLPLVRDFLLSSAEPGHVLAAFFLYDTALQIERAIVWWGQPLVELLLDLGLAGEVSGMLVPLFRVTPFFGLYIVADDVSVADDAVMSPGATTLACANLMGDLRAGAFLDLGCGPGTLALLAAKCGSKRSVGIDISSRAVALARINARLNDVAAEFRCGDLFDPVAGERFDRIISQPPYVLEPSGVRSSTFMHGGARGDSLLARIVLEVGDYLFAHGDALLSFHLPLRPDESALDRVAAWNCKGRLDLALWTFRAPSPSVQAAAYASMHRPRLDAKYAELALAYAAHFRSLEIEKFVACYAVLTPALAPTPAYFLGQMIRDPGRGAPSDWLDRVRASWIAARFAPARLIGETIVRAPNLVLVHEELPDLTGNTRILAQWDDSSSLAPSELSEASAAILRILSRPMSVRQCVHEFAEICEASAKEVASQVLNFIRESLQRGLVFVANGDLSQG